MPGWNGSGTFELRYNWVQDAANGVPITASRVQAQSQDFATGLMNCITRDGQTPPIADISWAGRKITNLANGTSPQDAATFSQISGLSGVFIARDGSAPPTADTPWGGHKITSLANGVAATDAVAVGQIQAIVSASATDWLVYSGSVAWVATNQFRVIGSNVVVAYHIGRRLKITHNTGASTSYATIIGSVLSGSDTIVTVLVDGGAVLVSTVTGIAASILEATNPAVPRWSFVSLMPSGGGSQAITNGVYSVFGNAAGNLDGFVQADYLSEFDLTTGTFTPKVSGYYEFGGRCSVTNSGVTWTMAPTMQLKINAGINTPGNQVWVPNIALTGATSGFGGAAGMSGEVRPMTAGVHSAQLGLTANFSAGTPVADWAITIRRVL